MATPFAHAHVTYVSKTGRRRSQSVTLPRIGQDDVPGQSIQHKQFFAQLQKERQKQLQNNNCNEQIEDLDEQQQQQQYQEDFHQKSVTRMPGANNAQSRNNNLSTETILAPLRQQTSSSPTHISDAEEDEQHQSVVTRVIRAPTTISTRKPTSLTAAISSTSQNDRASPISNSKFSQENEQYYRNQPQTIRVPRSLSSMSLKKAMSTTTGKTSNTNVYTTSKDSNIDSSSTLKCIGFNSSQLSSHPLLSSSTNLMSKSEIFDQKFYNNDNKDHARRNDGKHRGTISIGGKEKIHHNFDKKLHARSSASFMIAIIGMTIGIIAFIFALTSLILVLLLRSTVANALGGANSTSSGSSSLSTEDWPSSCSNYTTIDDPTRNVFAAGYALGCDNTAPFINRTQPVWIRFVGTGGTTLPLQTPGMDLCGSQGTGWYDGVMPSTSGQIVNGTACFTWYTSVCRYSQSISVANCDSFYIYLLPPAPACMMRYCTV